MFSVLLVLESLLCAIEILAMVSGSARQAAFWWNLRFLILPFIPVVWVMIGLMFIGLKRGHLLLILALLCLVPLGSQVFLWTESLHTLWVEHEVGWHRQGPYMIAELHQRIPGTWFTIISFYGLLLWLAGTVLFLIAAWNAGRRHLLRSLLITVPAFLVFFNAVFPVFNIYFPTEYNLFTPGTGLGIILFCIGIVTTPGIYIKSGHDNSSTLPVAEKELHAQGIFVLIFALMSAGILSAGYLSYSEFKQKYRTQIENSLSGIAKLKVFELQQWLQERSQDADILFENPIVADLIKRYLEQPENHLIRSTLHQSFSKYLSCTQYDHIALYDTLGVEKISVPHGTRVSEPDFSMTIREALMKRRVDFIDFRKDSSNGKIYLALIIPVISQEPDQHPLGVITLRINPQTSLYQSVQELPVPSTSTESLLVRREGSEILFLSDLKFRPRTAMTLRISMKQNQFPSVKAALGFVGITEGNDYRGVPVLADIRPVTGSPWFLITKMDMQELYSPIQKRLLETAMFIFVLIVTGAGGLWLVWRQQRMHFYRRQMESAEQIRESEEKFRYFFENVSVGKSLTFFTGEVRLNRAFCEMLGYTTQELERIRWQDITHADDIELSQKAMDRLIAGEMESTQFVKRYVHKNGNVVWGDVHTSLRRDANNLPAYFMTTVIDVTERIRAEEEIVSAKNFLDRIVEMSPFSMWISDPSGTVIRANQALLNAIGLRAHQIIGHYNVLRDENLEKQGVMHLVRAVFESRRPARFSIQWDSALAGVADFAGANKMYIDIAMFPVLEPQGTLSNVVCQWVDLTDRMLAEERLRAVHQEMQVLLIQAEQAKVTLQGLVEDQQNAQNEINHLNAVLEKRVQERTAELQNTVKELESFSYTVSHDLRAPIRAIDSYMGIIMEEFESGLDPECKRMGRIILDESKRMGQLIDDLLDFSRLGRHELKLVIIDMAQIARAVFATLAEPMDQNRIEFICGELPLVKGDPVLIRQLWVNLIDNSLKFTSKKEKAVIQIGCNTETDPVVYFIKDNGAGFDMQYVDKIFGVFQRLHNDHEFRGTGVGLAIVQRVVQRHGGRIWAEGTPGKGASFFFSI